jgi:hypothetical protein
MITTPSGFEEAVQGQLDETSNPDEVNQLVLCSIALSLKRIADSLVILNDLVGSLGPM